MSTFGDYKDALRVAKESLTDEGVVLLDVLSSLLNLNAERLDSLQKDIPELVRKELGIDEFVEEAEKNFIEPLYKIYQYWGRRILVEEIPTDEELGEYILARRALMNKYPAAWKIIQGAILAYASGPSGEDNE